MAYIEFDPTEMENGGDGTFDPLIETIKELGASAFNLEQTLGKIVFILLLKPI